MQSRKPPGGYDRIHCSAPCPFGYETVLFDLLANGGTIVFPFGSKMIRAIKETISSGEETVSVIKWETVFSINQSQTLAVPEYDDSNSGLLLKWLQSRSKSLPSYFCCSACLSVLFHTKYVFVASDKKVGVPLADGDTFCVDEAGLGEGVEMSVNYPFKIRGAVFTVADLYCTCCKIYVGLIFRSANIPSSSGLNVSAILSNMIIGKAFVVKHYTRLFLKRQESPHNFQDPCDIKEENMGMDQPTQEEQELSTSTDKGKENELLQEQKSARKESLSTLQDLESYRANLGTAIRCSTRGCNQTVSFSHQILSDSHCWSLGEQRPEPACYFNSLIKGTYMIENQRVTALSQGIMDVADVKCKLCCTIIGWAFLKAHSSDTFSPKNFVGRFGLVNSCFKIGSYQMTSHTML